MRYEIDVVIWFVLDFLCVDLFVIVVVVVMFGCGLSKVGVVSWVWCV